MIIDTSAWVDYSRNAQGALGDAVSRAVLDKSAMTTDVVRLELLAGISPHNERTLIRILAACKQIRQEPYSDVDDAIDLFRQCRRVGETLRSPNDCLIAAIAIRLGVPVLHRDRDFDLLGRYTPLQAVRE